MRLVRFNSYLFSESLHFSEGDEAQQIPKPMDQAVGWKTGWDSRDCGERQGTCQCSQIFRLEGKAKKNLDISVHSSNFKCLVINSKKKKMPGKLDKI